MVSSGCELAGIGDGSRDKPGVTVCWKSISTPSKPEQESWKKEQKWQKHEFSTPASVVKVSNKSKASPESKYVHVF